MQSAKIAAKQVSGNGCRAAQLADTLGKIGVRVVIMYGYASSLGKS